ncbi:MAG TPA: hypothetical protein VIL00_14745 [Pseudonocardiaceae bacterium]
MIFRRRRSWTVRLALAAVVVLASPGVAGGEPPHPVDLCRVQDQRLAELSGLASDGRQWYAVSDGGDRIQVLVLDRDCTVRRVITADVDPYDVEDLARAPDGTLWLADTGDNRKQRETVALHVVSPNGNTTLYRLTYPDGPHDAEALLLGADGTPYLVTKQPLGGAKVYRPARPLTSPGPTPLERVATVWLGPTDTPGGPVANAVGSRVVTGGAVSADGTVVALRTYTDAYLFPAPDKDVVAALAREPVRVPLPNEQQGEAIAFEPDGTLLSASEGLQPIRAVPHATQLVADRMNQQETTANEQTPAPGSPAVRDETEGVGAGDAGTIDSWRAWGVAGVAAALTIVVLGRRRRRRRS